ncbi:MAG: biopolymer transporter ExbD [Pirellulales bacterium]|nr:biopolymer transporter ExbD [Pirellulales bacterium]
MRIRHAGREDTTELQMTPMIDIVFQLLVFFVMTFRIALPEGDFSIQMPSASASATLEPQTSPTLQVRLKARADGELTSITLDGTSMSDFTDLQQRIRRIVRDSAGPGESGSDREVEIDCDYHLKYDYVIQAITAISGYVDPETRTPHKLIERIRFAPLQK